MHPDADLHPIMCTRTVSQVIDIEPRSEVPVYRQVAAALRARIESGELHPRRPLPSELHLQQEYGVARDTVRRALAALAEVGLVRTVPGRGTFVRSITVTRVEMEPGMRIFVRDATAAEKATLDLADGVQVLVIERRSGEVEVLPADSAEIRVS